MEKPGERDLSRIDLRTITPDQWEAVKSEVVRRARAERARVMRDLLQRLRLWWPSGKRRRVVRAFETLRTHPLHWSGRI